MTGLVSVREVVSGDGISVVVRDVAATRTVATVRMLDTSVELARLLDTELVSICEGDSEVPVTLIKAELTGYLAKKTESQKMGAVAELLVHLVLRTMGFRSPSVGPGDSSKVKYRTLMPTGK